MRVLLLNPPGRRLYVRDYFCSKTSKSNYLYHPVDLLALSGSLAAEHELGVLDAMAERLDARRAHERIEAFAPEVVVSLVGSVSWEEDRAFLREVARRGPRGPRIIVLGDLFQEDAPQKLASEPWIEAALHDFASGDAAAYLAGRTGELGDVTLREGCVPRRVHGRRASSEWRMPRPRHELFPERGYRFSFARRTPFATLLTDYGCPYPCSFCVIGTLGHRARPVLDVLEEVDFLRARGTRELFFADQTFGVRRARALELCAALAARGDLSWTAFTRPDLADRELLPAMARAGCHTLILGIESADEALLSTYRKGYRTSDARRAVALARELGMRTVGTFILGLPEETEQSLERSLALALELELDFLSFNVAVPRFATPFRARALELGLARERDLVMDQSGSAPFLATLALSRDELVRHKRRWVRRFYLRPRYLWRRLRDVRDVRELGRQAREGLALLARNL